MIGVVAWILLAAGLLGWEAVCRRSGGTRPGLGQAVSAVWRRRLGRWALVAAWAFVGFHLFARYTLPA